MVEQHLGVVIIIQNSNGQVMLGKRKNSYKAGFYGLPGGRVEPGEKLEVAALRELREETGVDPIKLEYLGFVKEFQAGFDFIHFVYECSQFTGQPQCLEPDKCEGWEWLGEDQIPPQTLPGHRAALLLLKGNQPFLEI